MKFTTLLALVASASAINMKNSMTGNECVKSDDGDNCVLKGTKNDCKCPKEPPVKELVQLDGTPECVPLEGDSYCVLKETSTICPCPGSKPNKKDPWHLAQLPDDDKEPKCVKKEGEDTCVVKGS